MNAMVSGAPRLATPADLPAPGGRVHLMGIGGAGMRGLAVLLADAGYRVSGCDRAATGLDDLTALGIPVECAHDASHVDGADLLIRSSAVPTDAPEVAAAFTKDSNHRALDDIRGSIDELKHYREHFIRCA